MDVWDLHAMRCQIGLKHRHDALNRPLSHLLDAAGRLNSVEPVKVFAGVQDAHERPDHCPLRTMGKTCLRTLLWYFRMVFMREWLWGNVNG
jgi:hypothetical protein